MKMKRGLMRQSRTTRDFSSRIKPGHMKQAFGTAVTKQEGQTLPDTGALVHISPSQQHDSCESGHIQTTLEENNPSPFCILFP